MPGAFAAPRRHGGQEATGEDDEAGDTERPGRLHRGGASRVVVSFPVGQAKAVAGDVRHLRGKREARSGPFDRLEQHEEKLLLHFEVRGVVRGENVREDLDVEGVLAEPQEAHAKRLLLDARIGGEHLADSVENRPHLRRRRLVAEPERRVEEELVAPAPVLDLGRDERAVRNRDDRPVERRMRVALSVTSSIVPTAVPMRTMSPTRMILSPRTTKPPKRFSRLFCAAKARATPPMPRPASVAVRLMPKLASAASTATVTTAPRSSIRAIVSDDVALAPSAMRRSVARPFRKSMSRNRSHAIRK